MPEFDEIYGSLESESSYDSLTGQVLPEVIEQRQDAVVSQAVQDMEKLVSLDQHPGWILVKEVMEKTILQQQNELLHSSHETAIRHFQSSIRARKELLGWLELKILEGKSLLGERNQVEKTS